MERVSLFEGVGCGEWGVGSRREKITVILSVARVPTAYTQHPTPYPLPTTHESRRTAVLVFSATIFGVSSLTREPNWFNPNQSGLFYAAVDLLISQVATATSTQLTTAIKAT
jgi:hypothetical protein